MPAVLATLLLVGLPAAGCRQEFATEGDGLRRQVLELETENRQLARRVDELEAELAREETGPGDWPADVRAAAPHVAAIELHRLSHVDDGDGDGTPDLLRAYVRPADGRGRFVQLAGELTLRAEVLADGAEAVLVGTVVLAPLELREAYRSGVLGTHYTIECPLAWPDGVTPSGQDLFVRAVYVDGRTGQRRADERTVRVEP